MDVMLFKFRVGYSDLVVSLSCWTWNSVNNFVCLVCTPESSSLLSKAMATANWRSHSMDYLHVGRGGARTVSSRSKLCIITFLTGVEVNQENQIVQVNSVVSQTWRYFCHAEKCLPVRALNLTYHRKCIPLSVALLSLYY